MFNRINTHCNHNRSRPCSIHIVVTVGVVVAVDSPPCVECKRCFLSFLQPSLTFAYVLDASFSQFVIVTSNVCIWRGIWNVLDAFLYPSDAVTSELASLVIGYAGYALLFALQWPTAAVAARLHRGRSKAAQVAFEDGVMVVATWLNVVLWRGGWDACVRYLLPDEKVVGGWATHYAGACGLLVLQVFNTVALNGIERDGAYELGDGIYPTRYLRDIFADKLKVTDETIIGIVRVLACGMKQFFYLTELCYFLLYRCFFECTIQVVFL